MPKTSRTRAAAPLEGIDLTREQDFPRIHRFVWTTYEGRTLK